MSYENLFSAGPQLLQPLKKQGSITWRCPSNIPLVKYWGKSEERLPCNPSISLTLTQSFTETKIDYQICEQPSVDFFFDGKRENGLIRQIGEFMDKLDSYFPFLSELKLEIYCNNSYSQSSGIGSVGSVIGALALGLCSIEEDLTGDKTNSDVFYRKAAFIARLGSGNATRSVYGGGVLWGKLPEIPGSSDLYGLYLGAFPFVETLNDTILIVSSAKEIESNTIGDIMMHNHTAVSNRFEQAKKHSVELVDIIRNEDYNAFCRLVEEEALTMQAMKVTSTPSYLLLFPGTVNIISKVRAFREITGIPICFTLDTGPNVHLLYPDKFKNEVMTFINDELLSYCEDKKLLDDRVGKGPMLIQRN